MRKPTTNEAIEKFKFVHGDEYDYSLVEYLKSCIKVTIICRIHGIFDQMPSDHLAGTGCPQCYGNLKLSTNEAIEKFKLVHGDEYDYSLVEYVKSRIKVTIICRTHGIFDQTPNAHLGGAGCPQCYGNLKLSTEQYIERAKAIHKDKYDYSRTQYINTSTDVEIICPTHGVFFQRANAHTDGQGCKECGILKKTKTQSSNTNEFINKANKIYCGKYDYSQVDYINANTKVCIICPDHGLFYQLPNSHLRGKECIKCCGKEQLDNKEFIKRSNLTHGEGTYDYSLVEYINAHIKVKIICQEHGIFEQTPGNHIFGHDCPKCNKNISKKSQMWLDSFNNDNIKREVFIMAGKNRYCVDGYDKNTNTVFEFNGDFWHGNPKLYDPNKLNRVSKVTYGELYQQTIKKQTDLQSYGYKVISIWESEFDEGKNGTE